MITRRESESGKDNIPFEIVVKLVIDNNGEFMKDGTRVDSFVVSSLECSFGHFVRIVVILEF